MRSIFVFRVYNMLNVRNITQYYVKCYEIRFYSWNSIVFIRIWSKISFFCVILTDDDGDEISIIDDDDLRILADRQKLTPIKLNVRSVESEIATKEKSPEPVAKSAKSVKIQNAESAKSATGKFFLIYIIYRRKWISRKEVLNWLVRSEIERININLIKVKYQG